MFRELDIEMDEEHADFDRQVPDVLPLSGSASVDDCCSDGFVFYVAFKDSVSGGTEGGGKYHPPVRVKIVGRYTETDPEKFGFNKYAQRDGNGAFFESEPDCLLTPEQGFGIDLLVIELLEVPNVSSERLLWQGNDRFEIGKQYLISPRARVGGRQVDLVEYLKGGNVINNYQSTYAGKCFAGKLSPLQHTEQ